MLFLATILSAAALTSAPAAPAAPAALPFRATLTATSHTPQIGRPWYYTVRITDTRGRPIAARVVPVILSGTRIIDTVGFFQIYGSCGHPYTWQPAHRGKRLVFQVRVRALGKLARLSYAVRVR